MSQYSPKRRSFIGRFLARFARGESGTLSIEAIMVFPLLMWSMMQSYTYFDGYLQNSRSQKATYALADVISRERDAMTTRYVDTLYGLLRTMVAQRSDVAMRITYLEYLEDEDKHRVYWSCIRGDGMKGWNNGNVTNLAEHLPQMPNNGFMIIVETETTYRRPFRTGFGANEFTMTDFVFTHPRVYTQIRGPDECIVPQSPASV